MTSRRPSETPAKKGNARSPKSAAERLLTDTGWLPEPLRAADTEFAMDGPIEGEGETRALPEFLAGDDDDTAEDLDEPQPHIIAAE